MRLKHLAITALSLPPALAAAATPEQRLAHALSSYLPDGPPQSCLFTPNSNDTQIIDENTILFRNGSRLWVNHPPHGCSSLSSGRTLVIHESEGRPCRGDIVRVTDLSMGGIIGSCALGDFIPYKRAKR